MSEITPNEYQIQFYTASFGKPPQDELEKRFAALGLPHSQAEANWNHEVNSAEYALRVVSALLRGDNYAAKDWLRIYREEADQSRGFGKEALARLQAFDIIDELYSGDPHIPSKEKLREIAKTLHAITKTPYP